VTTPGFENVQTAKVGGASLAVREQGAGDPVVFVHGGISDLRIWDAQLPEIGRSYRAISYSRRYALPNEPMPRDAMDPIAVHVDDLVAFLREVGAAPAHLVGNSWGALIALLTAQRHPEVVRSLVLEEAPAVTLFLPTVPPRLGDLLRLTASRPGVAIALVRFMVGTLARVERALRRGEAEAATRIFAQGVLGRKPLASIDPALRDQLIANCAQRRPIVLTPEPAPMRLAPEALRPLQIPGLLLTGELSPDYLVRLTDCLEELLPRSERGEIAGASHIMHAEDPAATNRAILDFLGRVG